MEYFKELYKAAFGQPFLLVGYLVQHTFLQAFVIHEFRMNKVRHFHHTCFYHYLLRTDIDNRRFGKQCGQSYRIESILNTTPGTLSCIAFIPRALRQPPSEIDKGFTTIDDGQGIVHETDEANEFSAV